jgi:hypothetical protein
MLCNNHKTSIIVEICEISSQTQTQTERNKHIIETKDKYPMTQPWTPDTQLHIDTSNNLIDSTQTCLH